MVGGMLSEEGGVPAEAGICHSSALARPSCACSAPAETAGKPGGVCMAPGAWVGTVPCYSAATLTNNAAFSSAQRAYSYYDRLLASASAYSLC